MRNFRRAVARVCEILAGRMRAIARATSAPGRQFRFESLEPRLTLDGVPAGIDNLMITELNYNPYRPTAAEEAAGYGDKEAFEFVELQNIGQETIDLTGVRFVPQSGDDIEFNFTGSQVTDLAQGEYVVVVANQAAFKVRYGTLDRVAGQWVGSLGDNGDVVVLKDAAGSDILHFEYEKGGGWPGRADGDGATLELDDPRAVLNLENGGNWHSSGEYGGTPGAEGQGPIHNVVINEVLAHTDYPQSDTIELYNPTGQPIDVGGWFLSDNAGNDDYTKFAIPAGTVIEAQGYLTFDERDFNPNGPWHPAGDESLVDSDHDFALSSYNGDHVWLMKGDGQQVTHFVDHVSFGASVNGESFGRWPNAAGDLYPMTSFTPGAPNSGPRVGPVLISEVMYNSPGSDEQRYEFIEVFNPFRTELDLTDWRIRKEADLDFQPGTTIPAHTAVVIVAFDPQQHVDMADEFRSHYQIGSDVILIGGYGTFDIATQVWSGLLSNRGATIQLQDWDEPPHGEIVPGRIIEDEVSYEDQAPWPVEADGDGSSLHRIDVGLWGNDHESWDALPPSPGTVPNFSPFAADDSYSVKVGETLIESFEGVLSNDNDPNGDDLGSSAVLLSGPSNGTLTRFDPDGSLTYVPNVGFHGEDSFTYSVTDAGGLSGTATVTIAVNSKPDEHNDSYTVVRGGTLVVDDAGGTQGDANNDGVLVNDTDDDGDALRAQLRPLVEDWPEHGSLTFHEDGTFTYVHDGSEFTTDSFKYRAYDGLRDSGNATVMITVVPDNRPPVAGDDDVSVGEDAPLDVTGSLLQNDSDPDDGDILTVTAIDTTGTTGLVTLAGDTVTYDPNGQFESLRDDQVATDTFGYTISDGQGGSATATVTVTIAGANDRPTGADDTAEAPADDAIEILIGDLLANDSDPDQGDALAIMAVDTTGTKGLVSLAGGLVTYDPNGQFESLAAGATTTDTFSYTVSDGLGSADVAMVTVTISGTNDQPTAGDDDATTATEDAAVDILTSSLLGNDSDPDNGDVLAVTAVDTTSTTGLVTLTGDVVTYDPNGQFESLPAGATTTDTFDYTISDGQGGTATATVTVTIDGLNDQPTAGDDTVTVAKDDAAADVTDHLLQNDSDPDQGDVLTVTAIDAAGTVGLVSLAGGVVTYDPNGKFESLQAGQEATDTFGYTIDDGQGGTATATVTITVTGENLPPTADDDTWAVDEDAAATDITVTLLGNDSDPDLGDVLTVTAVDTTETTGVVSLVDGIVTYDPDGAFESLAAGQNGMDIFGYTIGDGRGGTATATVTITITGANDLPTAGGDTLTVDEDAAAADVTSALLGSDSDPDVVDVLTVTAVDTTETAGLVSLVDGVVTYDPNGAFESLAAGQTSTDTFGYTIGDPHGGTATATVTVTVNGANDAPVANDDTAETSAGQPVGVDVLANDVDAEDGLLTIIVVDETSGTAVVNDGGTPDDPRDDTVDFTPAADFIGTAGFSYRVNDGESDSNVATVTVEVSAFNAPPVADDDVAVTDINTLVSIDVLANDSDPEGDPLTITILDADGGTAVVNDGGTPHDPSDDTVDFTPDSGFGGVASFTYEVSDGQAASDAATVTVTVTEPLGTIEFIRMTETDVSPGDRWYRFSAFRDGIFTAELDAGESAQDLGLTLYGVDGDGLDELSTALRRLDYEQAVGGQEYVLQVSGLRSGDHLTLANLAQLSPDGTQLTVWGTDGDDTFEVSAWTLPRLTNFVNDAVGATSLGLIGGDLPEGASGILSPYVTVNGLRFHIGTETSADVFGGGGVDVAELTGSAWADFAELRPNSATMTGPEYGEVKLAEMADITLHGGDGDDTVWFYDSPGDDHFVGAPNYGEMTGEGFVNRAESFSAVRAFGSAGGVDVARFYDSPGDDSLVGAAGLTTLTGDGFSIQTELFDAVHAFATSGGIDTARLYDSAEDDTFYASPVEAALFGESFYCRAKYFETVEGRSEGGGLDTAELFDSSGDDLLVATPASAKLTGTGFDNQATGFDKVTAYASSGGFDVAELYDSAGNDLFVASPVYGALSGEGYHNRTWSFDEVYAHGTAGGWDQAKLYDSPGDDSFYADTEAAVLYKEGEYYNHVTSFQGVHAYATAGGKDVANLQGSADDDLFYADDEHGAMFRHGEYYNRAKYFEEVYGLAGGGTDNRAFLFGSDEVDLLVAENDQARLFTEAADRLYLVTGFQYVQATATTAGDTKSIPDPGGLDFLLDLQGPWED